MIAEKLTQLFDGYTQAFLSYQLDDVYNFYHLPCCLSTPDKMLVIANVEQFKQEFLAIFRQLKQAQTKRVDILKASFESIDANTLLVCVDWQFVGNENQVFADFSAFYHLLIKDAQYKIISVSSHDLSQSKDLSHKLKLS